MDDDLFEVQIKQAMVARAESITALVDSTKFGKQGLASFAHIGQIDRVVTDDQITESHVSALRQTGSQVMICSSYSTRIFTHEDIQKSIRVGFATSSLRLAKPTRIDFWMSSCVKIRVE